MNNVIEHLPNPARILAECNRIMRPGGRLSVITPNVDSWGHKVFGPDWRGLEVPRHLFLFNRASLRSFARRAGFARTIVFTATGGGWGCLEASRAIARKTERGHPRAPASASILVAEFASDLLGGAKGEWVVLVADC